MWQNQSGHTRGERIAPACVGDRDYYRRAAAQPDSGEGVPRVLFLLS